MERHLRTQELLIFLNDEVLLPVASPNGQSDSMAGPSPEEIEVIQLPRYAAVLFRIGTWHSASFPLSQPSADAFVIFQNDTSENDIEIADLSEEIMIDR